ncbi:hypothetical protein BG006_002003 [Podila minutissima]|uniref:Uncharacterized protein n=1 Tax=Podila minutissima TaxID=64525 RepID=A0A9P5VNX3_9FUNG|nr:hypothetical protein BG006_002003 [Podila minutissima]
MRLIHFSALILATVLAFLLSSAQAASSIRYGKKISGTSTWFDGSDLHGAACYGKLLNKDVDAQDGWHIAAVNPSGYKGAEKEVCFECAKVTYNSRSIILDLTFSAFKTLAPLKVGRIKMTYEFIRCPIKGASFKWPRPKSA